MAALLPGAVRPAMKRLHYAETAPREVGGQYKIIYITFGKLAIKRVKQLGDAGKHCIWQNDI